ncbi:MAG: bifunctional diguanylate cyclase/phosphodiesterase [Saccharospirillum sp.]|nr:bifunctional diguanylate cyclase/phosphodiesterase [Saccharospirillum sp.]
MPDPFLRPARRTALIYLILGSVWILFSDQWAAWLFDDIETLIRVQTYKGWFYVAATALLVYWLMQRSLKRIRSIALEDSLTALPNRQAFDLEMKNRCRKGFLTGHQFCLAIIDIDHFKELNESQGHSDGDDVLLALTQQLRKQLGSQWYVARLGGDEFGFLSPVLDSAKACLEHLDVLQKQLTRDSDFQLLRDQSLSMGSCTYPVDGRNARDLMRHADMALFHAKHLGRNCHCHFKTQLKVTLMERLALSKDLRQACEADTFDLVYQPQWSVSKQRWVGAEVLIRWSHPERGMVSPAEFIPLAEEQGLIVRITELVVQKALTEIRAAGIDDQLLPRLSINLSHLALKDPYAMQRLQELLKEHPGPRPEILLEITETKTMENLDTTLAAMQLWHEQGVAFSIDDFGTGYSSLAMLKRLPLMELKIDREFIRELPDDANDAVITQTILAMAKTLSLEVVAEGVETQEQSDFLQQHGCDVMQGYFYARPMPMVELNRRLRP